MKLQTKFQIFFLLLVLSLSTICFETYRRIHNISAHVNYLDLLNDEQSTLTTFRTATRNEIFETYAYVISNEKHSNLDSAFQKTDEAFLKYQAVEANLLKQFTGLGKTSAFEYRERNNPRLKQLSQEVRDKITDLIKNGKGNAMRTATLLHQIHREVFEIRVVPALQDALKHQKVEQDVLVELIADEFKSLKFTLLTLTLVTLVLFGGASYLVVGSSVRRILLLDETAKNIDVSNTNTNTNTIPSIDATGKDEIASLTRSFISMQKRLTESKRKDLQLLKGLDSFIVAITDTAGKITYVNEKFSQISGYSAIELIGQDHRIINSGYQSKEFFTDMWQTIQSEKSWSGVICNRRKDGSFYWVDTRIIPITDANGRIERYIAVRTDISDRKASEKKLVESSKMASLGAMAGGVAHEINNPLAIISGKAHLLIREIGKTEGRDPARQLKLVEDIQRTAIRIGKIIKGLRTFSRDGEGDPFELVSVPSLMEDLLDLCRARLYNHGVELKLPAAFPNIEIECRATQIGQVFMNLIHNSDDAIETLAEKWIEVKVTETLNSVVFRFTDSGAGIPPEVAQRMMEPFFTTKPVGKGTGLGLSISKGIIQNHQGEMSIDGKSANTCFVVELPKKQIVKTVQEKKAA